MKRSRQALFHSAIALLLCFSMLVGTTFAWFTDGVASGNNTIAAGSLDIEMEYRDANGVWQKVTETTEVLDRNALWEPGHTEVAYLKITNAGSLALKYALGVQVNGERGSINAAGEAFKLSDFIQFGIVASDAEPQVYADRNLARNAVTDAKLIREGYVGGNKLYPKNSGEGMTAETYVTMVVYMPEEVGNAANYATGQEAPAVQLGIQLVATQEVYESDSFGTDYDAKAEVPGFTFPEGTFGDSISADVTKDENNKVAADLTISGANTNAVIPAGVQLAEDAEQLTLAVSSLQSSEANINLGKNDEMRSLNVHVEGVSADNTVPMEIYIKEAAAKGLNAGNLKLYHVENGATVEMTLVDTFTAHNQFKYDPATGDITLYMATFSEVALVADTVNAWNGTVDTTWYNTTDTSFTIANADQLAAFGAIVGDMAEGIERDSFVGKTVKLVADINLGDAEEKNNPKLIFYPIGYYNSERTYEKTGKAITSSVSSFEGTFDGAGHTIANFYQNTWEMKGDDSYYAATEQNYNDAMGLFGYVLNGTVKNLTVDNFSSDGEYTPTGVIATYADGNSTFENIAITNCNPRVYNTGNGGIIGIAGDTSAANDDHITLKNITVDNSNKISALWGSYDVACGGLVGMYRGNVDGSGNATGDTISFTNCHVSAQIDVYNDVCANYQYYAYRYAGMMIGSVRHNTKDGDKTIPDMTGISATGCTVNYGDWNDYYYCEFEKNSMASYSEDYQFSRVPHSELNFTDANGNGVVDADERASVTGCKHTHTAEENHQAIYLPFHQLFTGYSWGVSSIGLEEYSGIVTDLDITEGDQEESVEKFEGKVTELPNTKEIKLGDIFSFVDNGVELKSDALTVTVTNLDENNPVSAEFVRDSKNWENGTIEFSGTGKVQLTIQDYYFCTPTTITVTITDRQPAEKFESKFTGDFLYRVGNENPISVGSLFASKNPNDPNFISNSGVRVSIEKVDENSDVSGAFTANNTDWTKGTVKFSGTGVAKITITDNDYCIATELIVEVINATNLTSATGTTTGGIFVLVSDVNTSTYVNYWNCTVYGNGFTYSLNGAPTAYNSKQGHGILITKNATLDNLVIIGDVYNSYGAYTNQDYYNTAIDVVGDTTIQNCYIANCAAPVKARSNVTIKNTTLYGGTVANLLIMSGTATLENVTTANYDDGRAMIGMGIVIHSDATETAKLLLKDTLTQYNFISESKVPTDSYAKNLHTAMFSSDCEQYQFGTSPNRYVNTGIISLTSTFNGEDITDNVNTGYVGKSLRVSSYDGYVYTQPRTSGSVNNNAGEYKPTTQGAVAPEYSFDYTNKNYVAKTDGSNDYCYYEEGKVNISMDEGDTFNWDTSILTVTKVGKALDYTVSLNDTDYTGKSIAFNAAGDYTVKYTYTDDYNYIVDENGNITTNSKTYTKTVAITVAVVKATTKHAEFTFGSSNTASTTVTVGNNTYVMPNVTGTSSSIGSTTVNGQTIYYPIVEIVMSDGKTSHTSGWNAYFPVFSNAVTITDYKDNGTGDAETFNGETQSMPSGLSVVGDPAQLFKYQSSSTAGTSPVVKNKILVYSSPSISAKRSEYNTVIQYSYTDNAGATYYYYVGYHAPAQSYTSCVTSDTLVTLANGTQKRIDQVTYNDQLLAWDFYKGTYAEVPSAIIFDHGYDYNTVIDLKFSDGTNVKAVNLHQFFDADLNKFVTIDSQSVSQYVGHRFVKQVGRGYKLVTLIDYSVHKEYVEAYGIISAEHYNILVEGMFSTDFMPEDYDLFNYFEIGKGMTFNANAMKEDIATYGLYTYADFADYLTQEQFAAFNVQYFKIPVGKGEYTYEGIIALINEYLNN